MQFSIDQSILLVIDIQGNLALKMHDKDHVYKNVQNLIECAKILEIPIIHTEQAPAKIGKTIDIIAQHLKGLDPIAKSTFSCWGEPVFRDRLTSSGRSQIIMTGIEAHVCIYQTTADLLEQQYPVQIVADAVSARTLEKKTVALDRVRDLGAEIVTSDMLICELLKTAEHEKFRDVLKLMK